MAHSSVPLHSALDGGNLTTIAPSGGTGLETLVQTAEGDEARLIAMNWAAGIAIGVEGGHVCWTQKGGNEGTGSIRRAGIEIPAG